MLNRSNPLRRTRMKPGRPSKTPIPPEIAEAVALRANGACEACRFPLSDWDAHIHHRKLRSQGGEHTEANLLYVHNYCHEAIHSSKLSGVAYDFGLLVRSWLDPADVPVRPFGSTVWAEQ
jgi:5-methylcytosine-specific restriction endonuclease McrA